MDRTPGSLATILFCCTVTPHVKLVSAVLRGERVRVEKGRGERERGAGMMVVRPPDTMMLPSLFSQTKLYCKFPPAWSTMAEQLRVVSPTSPATRGPGSTDIDTTGVETVLCTQEN